jgi:hypothetical protein
MMKSTAPTVILVVTFIAEGEEVKAGADEGNDQNEGEQYDFGRPIAPGVHHIEDGEDAEN